MNDNLMHNTKENATNNKLLSKLPKILYKNRSVIDWKSISNLDVNFVYDGITDCLKVVEYNNKTRKLKINYKNNIYWITDTNFSNCRLGIIVGEFTKNFKVEIGKTFKDNKRDLTIVDREYRKDKNNINRKWYKYKCNVCGWNEGWIIESSLLSKSYSCTCCANKIVVKGINDIATTNPEMVKYFVNIEDAYKYTYSSKNNIYVKCPDCGYTKEGSISNLYYRNFSCPKCGDGVSYPEKFMSNLFKQLKENNQLIDFIYQYTKVNNILCGKYKYDFYFELENEKYIIETHGRQHYEKVENFKITLEEVKQNDINKMNLAIQNGIKPENYIVVDCKYSESEYIKYNILNSRLNEIFDLSNINWIKIGLESEKSLIKEVCEYWNNKHNNETTSDLANTFKCCSFTIINYLKKCSELELCSYNPKIEKQKSGSRVGKALGKPIEIFKGNESLGIFESISELERQSEELFKTKLNHSAISKVCLGKLKHYKGFTFKYVQKIF